jgi:hypothetical protein
MRRLALLHLPTLALSKQHACALYINTTKHNNKNEVNPTERDSRSSISQVPEAALEGGREAGRAREGRTRTRRRLGGAVRPSRRGESWTASAAPNIHRERLPPVRSKKDGKRE